jgi:hypothetical protein
MYGLSRMDYAADRTPRSVPERRPCCVSHTRPAYRKGNPFHTKCALSGIRNHAESGPRASPTQSHPTSMARPQKSPDDRASAAFRIRLTAAERELLGEKAAAAGVTLSALIRVAVLGYRLPPALVWGEVINELKRIGINLDQMARRVDATGGLRADLDEALAEVRQAISRILSMA